MTKKAIKILLAVTVMIATFVVITVVASASDYVAGYNNGDGYWYKVGELCESGRQVIYVPYPTAELELEHVWFPDFCDSAPSVVLIYSSCGSTCSDTDDWSLDSECPFDIMGYDELVVFYSDADLYFHVKFINSLTDLPGYGSGDSGSGDSGSGDSGSGDSNDPDDPGNSGSGSTGDVNSGSGRDEYPWIYDPTDMREFDISTFCDLGEIKIPTFFVLSDVDYGYFVEEACAYVERVQPSLGRFDSFSSSDWYCFDVFTVYDGSVALLKSSYAPQDTISFPKGEYIVLFKISCDCSGCDGYEYEYVPFCVVSNNTLPDDPSNYYAAYNRGYSDGYSKGYGVGYSSYQYLLSDIRSQAYKQGLEAGRAEGFLNGFEDGYDNGEAAGYDIGYNDGDSYGYDRGYGEGYTKGRSVGYESGYSTCKMDILVDNIDSYTEGYNDGMLSVIDNEGDAISGFFAGISGSVISSLRFADDEIRIWNMSILDLVAFGIFVIVAAGIVLRLIRKFI